ncbi:MAG TPA: GlsB/YeaQ/YmgE family stress response membrane protein [Gaiellaceae bacterium]|nr:GlsB/YeaQ/YmgE family stress response membrane protein [Gaiellaceae bacterium]
MGVISFLLFGLVAGLVARLVTPGRQAIGCLPTVAVGIVGAFLGGVIGNVVLGHKVHFGWHWGPFLLAVVGAVVLLLLLEAIQGKRRFRPPWS